MSVKAEQILALLDNIAPFALAEEWDNVGLLAGSRETEVKTVLCALDLTEKVLDEALEIGAQMIVTHHPILFRARRNLCADDAEGRLLVRLAGSRLAMAAMHTNFDNAHPGVNDALAAALGMQSVESAAHGMCVGELPEMTLDKLTSLVSGRLGGCVRAYGEKRKVVHRIAVLGGAGEDFASDARALGADAYITGETAYHKALSAVDEGLCVLEAGHAATENPGVDALCKALQNAANDVQYNICVRRSAQGLFL